MPYDFVIESRRSLVFKWCGSIPVFAKSYVLVFIHIVNFPSFDGFNAL